MKDGKNIYIIVRIHVCLHSKSNKTALIDKNKNKATYSTRTNSTVILIIEKRINKKNAILSKPKLRTYQTKVWP